jgi:hypothetical protein
MAMLQLFAGMVLLIRKSMLLCACCPMQQLMQTPHYSAAGEVT